MEALASGLPVVATDVGEVPFLLNDATNGVVCRTDKNTDAVVVENLAQGISRVLKQSWGRTTIQDSVAGMTWPAAAEIVMEGLKQGRKQQRRQVGEALADVSGQTPRPQNPS
jgi:glycosyltransferase involved in cell wall biosynthesis